MCCFWLVWKEFRSGRWNGHEGHNKLHGKVSTRRIAMTFVAGHATHAMEGAQASVDIRKQLKLYVTWVATRCDIKRRASY